jgi:L-fucono-1,5-lactonase
MKIDSHHHFWKYSEREYGWIGDNMKALRRDFLPPDLAKEIAAAGIEGVVSVQARQTLEETQFLLEYAEGNDFIRGVVGWVPLVNPAVSKDIEKFAGRPKLKALRHVLQDEPDDNYILRDDFNRGIRALRDVGLVYDILIYERHLPQTLTFVDRHPDQVFVLDHIAKPRIKDNLIEPWRANIRRLAERPHIYCKLSGMVTEADWQNWTPEQLRPYFDVVLQAFGPRRLMFGSDWPVCLVAASYQKWVTTVTSAIAKLTADEQARIWGGTAVEAYGL